MIHDAEHEKKKKHFLIERIVFFSDAVIAIAVTLLIIEIHAPLIKPGSDFHAQLEQLSHLAPEFVSFILSFWLIYQQWMKHHTMFGHVIDYNDKLIVLNSLFLFAISVIPFSTSFVALNYEGNFELPMIVYGLNMFAVTLMNFLLFNHITNKKNKLYDHSIPEDYEFWIRAEYLLIPIGIVFLFGSMVFDPKWVIYAAIPFVVAQYFVRHKLKITKPKAE